MTVLCLIEEADGQAADVSLRALTFARQLAGSSGQAVAAAVFGDPDAVPAEVLSGYGVSDAEKRAIPVLIHLIQREKKRVIGIGGFQKYIPNLANDFQLIQDLA